MIEFIDKTSTQSGTPINRSNLMAIQGFSKKTTEFKDGKIIETNPETNHKLTISFENGNIIEKFEGSKTITKTTSFGSDGKITEVIS